MGVIKFYSMVEYCEAIKQYFLTYNSSNHKSAYGDKIKELKELIKRQDLEGMAFILYMKELIGGTTRILGGWNNSVPFLKWIGGEETFSRDSFINSMKQVWPELLN